MSDRKFSLSRYSLGDIESSTDINIVMHVSEKITCTAGIGGDLPLSERFDTAILGKQRLTLAFIETFAGEESLHAVTTCLANLMMDDVKVEEALLVDARALLDVHLDEALSENLNSAAYLSCDTPVSASSSSALQAKAAIAADMHYSIIASEALNSDVVAVNLEREVAVLNVTIPAGGRLIIDSDFFTATLNDENIIDLYSGDWITLCRDLLELDVDSGTGGNLVGKVIYTERYL